MLSAGKNYLSALPVFGRRLGPLDRGHFLPPDLRKGGLPNEHIGSFRALSRDHWHLQPVPSGIQKEVTAPVPTVWRLLLVTNNGG